MSASSDAHARPQVQAAHTHASATPTTPTRHAFLTQISRFWNFALLQPSGNGSSPASSAPSGTLGHTASAAPSITCVILFPQNPSVGLRHLGPLVPASDNKPALLLVTTAQFLAGLTLMTRRVPKVGELPLRRRAIAALRFTTGLALVTLSAMEYGRCNVVYDPWREEAVAWRKWAVRHGHRPSWWSGAIRFYEPLSLDEWIDKFGIWAHMVAVAMDSERKPPQMPSDQTLANIAIGPNVALRVGGAEQYRETYNNLRQMNAERTREYQTQHLRDVTELNKAERIDAILDSPTPLNEDYIKPQIQLGKYRMELDEEFEMVWASFDPWDELADELDFDVRFMPRWRCSDELAGYDDVDG